MLAKATIIRAWRDKAFRASLSEKELENLPLHPSGVIEIPDAILNTATGGTSDVTGDPAGASTCYNACGGGGGGGSAIVKGGVCCM